MPPRFLPDVPFPPYAHVPGRTPHPESDPAGHSFGRERTVVSAIDTANWGDNKAYLRGLDLFNHGYYWEAHEAWEALWHAAGRRGVVADFLKGLIHLAAAGVKGREGQPAGVASHARRAGELFRLTAETTPTLLGLSLEELGRTAALAPQTGEAAPGDPPILFPFALAPNVEAPP